jgi:hypothetical protein
VSFSNLYRSQVKTAENAVTTARRNRDNKQKSVRSLENEISKLEDRLRKTKSDSQAGSYQRQIATKSGRLTSARNDLGRGEEALSKAEDKLATSQKKLREQEEKEHKDALRKQEQEKKKAEQRDRLDRQREEAEARRLRAEQATREAQQDERIGELEERLVEAERRSAPPEITVLFLAASPEDESPLRLDKETREIQKRMRSTDYRESIFFEWRLARRTTDLIDDLNQTHPDVLHFSGHGNTDELAFEDNSGNATGLTSDQVKRLLDAAPKPIRLIVFNSCHSAALAKLAVKHVEIAIGMEANIGDAEAQTFAGQFYNSLGFGMSVARAFEQARLQIELEHGGGHEIPKLVSADDIDPETVVLVNPDGETVSTD